MNGERTLYSVADRIGTITLNRPEKRNALDERMVAELTHRFLLASKDSSVKVLIIEGAGKHFCAGADLLSLQKLSSNDFNQNLDDSKSLMRLFQFIYTMRKPVLAKVHGAALAGGCGLATVCDFIIASSDATFGYTEVRIGFVPAIVLPFLVKRIGESRARQIVLDGRIISSQQALEYGLVNETVPAEQLDAVVQNLAARLCNESSSISMGLIKEMFAKINGAVLDDALDYAANMNAAARMSDDCKKGIDAFLSKKKINW